jgi:hypothetical protein
MALSALFMRIGNVGRCYLVHQFGGRVAEHSLGTDVEDLNYTLGIGRDIGEISARENRVLESADLASA